MSDQSTRSPAQPAVVLGLTFLLIGLTFALPLNLVPESDHYAISGRLSQETANVYACVAWAGWAHFLFAFRGQGKALLRRADSFTTQRLFAYIGCLIATIAVLVGLRWAVGASIFGAVVWVYFIDHFMKAELAFEGKDPSKISTMVRWVASYQPLLTFGWLSIVLMNVQNVNSHPWILWTVSSLLAALVLLFGGWRSLVEGNVRNPLLSLFFVAEAMVWGTFSRYGGPVFLAGVYVFHIAAGSYVHYLGSYFVAHARNGTKDRFVLPLSILAVNLVIIAIGFLASQVEVLRWLEPIIGIQWFTLWVAVHLVASDLFPAIKNLKQNVAAA